MLVLVLVELIKVDVIVVLLVETLVVVEITEVVVASVVKLVGVPELDVRICVEFDVADDKDVAVVLATWPIEISLGKIRLSAMVGEKVAA